MLIDGLRDHISWGVLAAMVGHPALSQIRGLDGAARQRRPSAVATPRVSLAVRSIAPPHGQHRSTRQSGSPETGPTGSRTRRAAGPRRRVVGDLTLCRVTASRGPARPSPAAPSIQLE
jgi:hypothetical protein